MTHFFVSLCATVPMLAFIFAGQRRQNFLLFLLIGCFLLGLQIQSMMIVTTLLTFLCLFSFFLLSGHAVLLSFTLAGTYFCNNILLDFLTNHFYSALLPRIDWRVFLIFQTVISCTFQFFSVKGELLVLKRYVVRESTKIIAAVLVMSGFLYTIWSSDLPGITAADTGALLQNVLFTTVLGIMAILLLLAVITQRTIEEKTRIAKERIELESTARYYEELSKNAQQLRNFKHDFQNICLGINLAIKSGDIDEITDYFHQHIQKAGQQLIQQNNDLLKLEMIQSLPIKSLFYAKLGILDPARLTLTIEIHDDIELPKLTEAPLVRGLGIILDNALEELAELNSGKLIIGIQKDGPDIIFTVENTCRNTTLSLSELQTDGFSTKGPDRGFGLNSLALCFSQSPFLLKTSISGGLFSQIVRIEER